jgi:hypothetical protein
MADTTITELNPKPTPVASTDLFAIDDASGVTWSVAISAIQTYFNGFYVALSGSTMTGPLVLNANPTTNLEAATKNYVDMVAAGLAPAGSVTAATTVNFAATYFNGTNNDGIGASLTASSTGVVVFDTETVVQGGDYLFKNQSSAVQNGIYFCQTAGAVGVAAVFIRSQRYDTPDAINNTGIIPITNGTQAQQGFYEADTIVNIGTDALVYIKFGNTGTVTSVASGTGLSGGTITNTGTLTLAPIPTGTLLANTSGSTAIPIATLISSIGSPFVFGTGANSALGGDGTSTNAGDNSFLFGTNSSSITSIATNSFGVGSGIVIKSPFCFVMGQGTQNNFGGGTHSFIMGQSANTGSAPNHCFIFGNGASVNNSCTAAFALGSDANAQKSFAFALGRNAKAVNQGSWVSTDSSNAPNADTANDQHVSTYAGGYYYYLTSSPVFLPFQIDALGNVTTGAGIAENGSSIQTPTTGTTITLALTNHTTLLTPAGTLAALTLDFPTPTVNQRLKVISTAAITALTLTPTGADVFVGAVTSLAAGQSIEYLYNVAAATWYPFSIPSAGGGGSSPVSAGTGTGSAIGGDGTSLAAGNYAFAYGNKGGGLNPTTASGLNSFAFGTGALSEGTSSFSFGQLTQAMANFSFAFGLDSVTTGEFSFAFGNTAVVNFNGNVVWGDSQSSPVSPTVIDQWAATFDNGFYFYTNNTPTLGMAVDTNANFITGNGVAVQGWAVQTPVTGFSITLLSTQYLLPLTPAGTLATGTIIMPTTPINGQRQRVSTTQTISVLTVSPNTGQSIARAPTTLVAGQSFEMFYNLAITTWLPF